MRYNHGILYPEIDYYVMFLQYLNLNCQLAVYQVKSFKNPLCLYLSHYKLSFKNLNLISNGFLHFVKRSFFTVFKFCFELLSSIHHRLSINSFPTFTPSGNSTSQLICFILANPILDQTWMKDCRSKNSYIAMHYGLASPYSNSACYN